MKQDNMPQVTRFWNDIASDFDAIYTGRKSAIGRFLDRWLRKDIYQRFDWIMERCGDVRGREICDIGCGSGRFVVEFAKRGAAHVTGLDVAPEMLRLSQELVTREGVAENCDFVLNDIRDWRPGRKYDITIASGFWDYIQDPRERLKLIRDLTGSKFLSTWPRFWTWRMPVRKVRLQYVSGCPVYFYPRSRVIKLLTESGFEVLRCDAVGKLFCVEARPSA